MRLLRYLYGLSLASISQSNISAATTQYPESASPVAPRSLVHSRVWPTAGLHAWPAPPRDLAVHAQAVKMLWSQPKRRDRSSFIVRLPACL
ncbi:hypothetical protein HDV64DRAFT_226715 [Trichoderma sp. TUCIM 5745]